MREKIMREAGRISSRLSWRQPRRMYYSLRGRVVCPVCSNDVNIRDLVGKGGAVYCKDCK